MSSTHEWSAVLAGVRAGVPAESRPAAIEQALGLGHDIAPGIIGCSLTEVVGDGWHTPSASTPMALELDRGQYALETGPCIAAATERSVQRMDAGTPDDAYNGFTRYARERGVRSSLSLPLAADDRRTALNLYSQDEAAFTSDRANAVAQLLARVLSTLTAPSQHGPRDAATLELAQEQGRQVRAAVERLMSTDGLDRSGAFAWLTLRSQERQASLADIVGDVLSGSGGIA